MTDISHGDGSSYESLSYVQNAQVKDSEIQKTHVDSLDNGAGYATAAGKHQRRKCMRFITVEPSVIGTMFIMTLYSILSKEYFYRRIAADHNFNLNGTTEPSCGANKSDPYYEEEQKVSAETAWWTLYLGIATFLPELIANIVLGSWADRIGRKPPISISLFGFVILMSCYLLVIIFHLPLHFLFIGHILSGFLGDFGNLLGCSFSYLADVTTPQRRALRMAVLETGIGIGGFVASMTSGLWDLKDGFGIPYSFMLGFALLNFLYTVFCLPPNNDGKSKPSFRNLFSKEPFQHMYQVMRPRQNNRHIALILLAISFCILMATATGMKGILVVYTIGVPFCWNSMLIGLLSGMGQISFFVSLIMLKLFSSFSVQPRLVMLSIFTSILSTVTFAFATTTWMVFLASTFQIFFNLPSPIIRSQASRIVSRGEVGSVFGILACAMAIGETIGTVAFQSVFAATVGSALPGAAFLIATGLFFLMIPLYWIGYRVSGLKQTSGVRRYSELSEYEEHG